MASRTPRSCSRPKRRRPDTDESHMASTASTSSSTRSVSGSPPTKRRRVDPHFANDGETTDYIINYTYKDKTYSERLSGSTTKYTFADLRDQIATALGEPAHAISIKFDGKYVYQFRRDIIPYFQQSNHNAITVDVELVETQRYDQVRRSTIPPKHKQNKLMSKVIEELRKSFLSASYIVEAIDSKQTAINQEKEKDMREEYLAIMGDDNLSSVQQKDAIFTQIVEPVCSALDVGSNQMDATFRVETNSASKKVQEQSIKSTVITVGRLDTNDVCLCKDSSERREISRVHGYMFVAGQHMLYVDVWSCCGTEVKHRSDESKPLLSTFDGKRHIFIFDKTESVRLQISDLTVHIVPNSNSKTTETDYKQKDVVATTESGENSNSMAGEANLSVLDAYVEKYGRMPDNASQLRKFSQIDSRFKTLPFVQAKQMLLGEKNKNSKEKQTKSVSGSKRKLPTSRSA